MGKKILFSPIGNTDPIKYFHDGSMHSYCQSIPADEIYLYLTKRMLVTSMRKITVCQTVELLGEQLNQ